MVNRLNMMRKSRPTRTLGRRGFLELSAAAAVWGSSGRAHAKPVHADEGLPTILLAGDSMIAGGFGLFLERALAEQRYPVRRRGKSSSGLARPDFFDWQKEARRLIEGGTPDLSIVMFGGNDVQGLYMGGGEWIRWHEEAWPTEYTRRMQAFCDVLAPEEQPVVWVGLPIMRPERFRGRVERMNTLYREFCADKPNIHFVDTWTVLADADGEYADRIVLDPEPVESGRRSKRVRVRAGDGIHLSPAGAHVLKAHVLDALKPILIGVQSMKTWETIHTQLTATDLSGRSPSDDEAILNSEE